MRSSSPGPWWFGSFEVSDDIYSRVDSIPSRDRNRLAPHRCHAHVCATMRVQFMEATRTNSPPTSDKLYLPDGKVWMCEKANAPESLTQAYA